MGHRLSKIQTRTGDDGSTLLGDGRRVPKDSLRIEAMGLLDEVNAHLGLLVSLLPPQAGIEAELLRLQHLLFDLGSELCLPGQALFDGAAVVWVEQCLERHNRALPPLREFILPGGGRAAAQCHVARCVCRRAERVLVALGRHEALRPPLLAFINRVSDHLFVLARVLARVEGADETCWQNPYAR